MHHLVAKTSPGIPLVLLWLALPVSGSAHTGGAADAGGRGWASFAAIAGGLALAGALYAQGVAAIWMRAGTGRGVPTWRVASFFGGLLVLALALLSPLDAWSGELFAAHMVQHVLLMLAAAPLLVLGAPLAPMLWALPASWRRPLGRTSRVNPVHAVAGLLTNPIVVGMIGIVALWLWHMPRLYDAALRSDLTHAMEHASFLGAALLFWQLVFPAGRRRAHPAAVLLLVFVTMLQSGGLGALITFAQSPWYAVHGDGAAAWNLTPLQDQQLAGTIMWVPMGAVYLLAALWIVAAWLRAMERANPANDRPSGDRVVVPRASEGGIA